MKPATPPKTACLFMVGILVDAPYRLNRTREEFAAIFDEIQGLFEEEPSRAQGFQNDLLARDRWRKIDPEAAQAHRGLLVRTGSSSRKHYLRLL